MADLVRDEALMSMNTTLGGDALIPTYMLAEEAISHTFEYTIHAISQKGAIKADDILNHPICVTLRDGAGPVRHFHGIVREIRRLGVIRGQNKTDEYHNYELIAVPRLWFLDQTQDARVYQNKSVKDILSAVFQDANLTDVTFAITAGAARPYTIQFNESDLAFATRLMEEEGCFYYFEHTDTKHTLVITDKNTTFKDIPKAKLHFAANEHDSSGILEWQSPVRTTAGAFKTRDYDPEKPGTLLMKEQKTVLKTNGSAARDIFRWPALGHTTGIIESRAKFAMEAAEAAVALHDGMTHFGALVPGGKLTIANTPASPDDDAYAVQHVFHTIHDETWTTSDGTVSYQNHFRAFKMAVPWRQSISTPRPRMEGIHTAIVMGPQSNAGGAIKMQEGEEIHTDDLARVKVRFFWDHRAEATGGASIWARVIQPWAGNGWGAQFIPRVGTEVAVGFVDGDPDRPIVLGGLYNGISAPIYSKADKTKSGFRTRSSLKGGTAKFNELTFDDKHDHEMVYIHAEKDMKTHVEHDQSLTVDNCRMVYVKVDETVTIKGKQSITVTKDHTFKVEEGHTKNTISKGNSSYEVSKGNHDMEVKLGNISIKAGAGKITMKAAQSIELIVGGSSIKIDPMGITIKGAMKVEVEGGMFATFKSGLMTKIDGTMTDIKGAAMTTLKGAIVMIN